MDLHIWANPLERSLILLEPSALQPGKPLSTGLGVVHWIGEGGWPGSS